MTMIRPSSDLRNKYAEISEFCNNNDEPVFITKNGYGDLVVMSIEKYSSLSASSELYLKLSEGLQDIDNGKTTPAKDVFDKLLK